MLISHTGCVSVRFGLLVAFVAVLVVPGATEDPPAPKAADKVVASRFIDLSLLVAPDYPCTWPTFPIFQINHYQKIGPLGAFNSDILVLDGNTGTQLDVPPHSVTPIGSGLPTLSWPWRSICAWLPGPIQHLIAERIRRYYEGDRHL